MDAVEVRYSHFSGYRFPPHVHDTWSVGLIDAGCTVFRMDGQQRIVHAGQVVVIPPGAAHDCNPREGSWTYRMLYVPDSLMQRMADDISGSSTQRVGGLAVGFDEPVIGDARVFAAFSGFQRLVEHGADPLPRRTAMTEAFSRLLVGYADVRDARPDAANDSEHAAVRAVRAYLAENHAEKVTLDDLARVGGLSPYHLLRIFRAETGLTPHQWQVQLRLNRAKTLLSKGASIADTAAAAGFTDQSHFSRTFRTYTGATPGLYRMARSAA
ncbi:AraC family transcriptional regulator [Desulfovibrio psychrotolerans]|uniref:AraC family transcriptional regulator n=1 Tax=Desulfovibrio psychrotolerans TaxID=415242 RepID=A0A7J0BWV6_9BACT|nr:AraC family transcriptional regulator [Desulfovibrio psychrotolerans]